MKTTHAVTILGRPISVRTPASEAKVRAVEAFVNDRLQTIGSALSSCDAQLVLTLALLNTTEELLELRRGNDLDTSIDSRMLKIIKKLEAA